MGGDEILKHRETFAEVRDDRTFDDFAGGLGHQSAHAAELFDLGLVTPRTGIDHHEEWRCLLLAFVELDLAIERVGDGVGGLGPDVDDLLVALAVGDDAVAILLGDFFDFFVSLGDDCRFLLGDDHVNDTDRSSRTGRFAETEGFEFVEDFNGLRLAGNLIATPDDVADLLFADVVVDEAHARRPDFIETNAARSGLDDLTLAQRLLERSELLAVLVGEILALVTEDRVLAVVGVTNADPLVIIDLVGGEGELDFGGVFKEGHVLLFFTVLLGAGAGPCQVIRAENDVLGRNRHGTTGCRREDVVRREHQLAALHLGLDRKRDVDGHLVTVEVRVVGGTNERVNADGLAFDELRFEGLDGKTVKGRRAVEKDRVTLGDFREDVPDFGGLAVDHLLGRAHGVAVAKLLEAADDERFEQGERHLLGKTALAELEIGTDDDDGTAGVIDTFSEKVLTETTALALEHVGERLERTVAGTGDGATVATVVEQRVNSLLQHPLFVADDDFRRFEEQEVLEAVVAVDDAAIEVVEVGGGETSAFEWHQRTKVRRDHRKHGLDHPLGTRFRLKKTLSDLETLRELLLVLLGTGGSELFFKSNDQGRKVALAEQFHDSGGTHAGLERSVAIGVFRLAEFVFREELADFEGGVALFGDDVVFIVNHALQLAGTHVEHEADAGRHALVEPDVGNRHGQFDVAHALATDAAQGHFDAATVADHALVLDPLVFAAGALPVAGGSEDPLAEETAFFGLEGPVVDGFRVLHLALGPGTDDFRGSHGDGDLVKLLRALVHAE